VEAEIDRLVYSPYGLTREETLEDKTTSREAANDAAVEQET